MDRTENTLVTIIVPIYNVERFLPECVNSILNQTYQNLEIILVDDGSPDNCGKICDEFAKSDSRVKVIHQKNAGVSVARNVAIDIARGEYIVFVDGDDTVCTDFVQYLLSMAIETNCDIAISKDCFRPFHEKQNVDDQIQIWPGKKAVEQYLLMHLGPIGCWNKMIKTTFLLDSYIRFVPELKMGEGLTFISEIFARANRVAVGNRKVFTYRRDNAESATTKFDTARWIHALDTIDRLEKIEQLNTKSIQSAICYHRWLTYYIILKLIIDNHARNSEREMYKECVKFCKKNAPSVLKMPVSMARKMQGIICLVSPRFAVLINNVLKG